MLLAAMAAAVHRLVAAEGALLGAELGQGSMQVGLVVLDADQQGIACLGSPREPLSLAMQRVGGEEHAGHAKLGHQDRKSTRLNSSHANISYAVFCLKKKK